MSLISPDQLTLGVKSVTGRVLNHVSPSQLTTFGKCARKWHWNKVEGLDTPTKPAQERGKRVHSELEDYLKTGKLLNPERSEYEAIALPGLPHLPEPGTPGMLVEHEFKLGDGLPLFLPPKEGDLPAEGFRDLRLVYAPRPGRKKLPLRIDGVIDLWLFLKRAVADHKTTYSLGDAKTEEQLSVDSQAIIYGKYDLEVARALGLPEAESAEVEFRHIYYRTQKGRPGSHTSKVMFTPQELDDKFDFYVVGAIEKMIEVAQVPVTETPFNVLHCREYQGCDFYSRCAGVGTFKNMSVVNARVAKSKELDVSDDPKMAEFLAKVKAREQGAKPAPAKAQEASKLAPEPTKAQEAPKLDPVKAQEAPKPDPVKAQEAPKPDPVKAQEAPKPEPVKVQEAPKPEPVKAQEAPASTDTIVLLSNDPQLAEKIYSAVNAKVDAAESAMAEAFKVKNFAVGQTLMTERQKWADWRDALDRDKTNTSTEAPIQQICEALGVQIQDPPPPQVEAAPELPLGINPPDGTPMDVVGELEQKKGRRKAVTLPDGRPVNGLKLAECVEVHKALVAGMDSAGRAVWLAVTVEDLRLWVGKNFEYGGKRPPIKAIKSDLEMICGFLSSGEMVPVGALSDSDKADEDDEAELPGVEAVVHEPKVGQDALVGRFLYVGCIPRNKPFVHLDTLMQPYFRSVEESSAVAHYFDVKGYNEAPRRAASVLVTLVRQGKATLPAHVVADRRSPSADAVVEAIAPLFDFVIDRLG